MGEISKKLVDVDDNFLQDNLTRYLQNLISDLLPKNPMAIILSKVWNETSSFICFSLNKKLCWAKRVSGKDVLDLAV